MHMQQLVLSVFEKTVIQFCHQRVVLAALDGAHAVGPIQALASLHAVALGDVGLTCSADGLARRGSFRFSGSRLPVL